MVRLRTAALAGAVPLTLAAAVALALKAGAWQLSLSRHAISLSPAPRPNCPDCKGEGGWWSDGPFPGGEVCWCWDRPTRTLQLLPRPDWDEPPF